MRARQAIARASSGIDRAQAWGRLDLAVLAGLTVLYLATIPFAITHLDLARDVASALAIARGEEFPLQGPIFAGRIHLGPVWYYLLALPLALTSSWTVTVAWIGLIGALKIPLAYAVGVRLDDRRTGLLLALLLLLPGWWTFETLLPLHTSLVATCTLLFVLALLRYEAGARPIDLGLAGLAFALALHAHPSTFGLAVLLVAVLVRELRRRRLTAAALAHLVAGALLPFLPYVVEQVRTDFPDWRQATQYLSDDRQLGSFAALPELIVGIVVTGPAALARGLMADVPAATSIAVGIAFVVWIAGLAGAALAIAREGRRARIMVAAAMTIVTALTVVLVRSWTPYYMVFVIWMFAAIVLALGLRTVDTTRWLRVATKVLVAIVVSWVAVTQVVIAHTLAGGGYRFAFFPLFDVKRAASPAGPMPFVPAYAVPKSGRWLCANTPAHVHGSYEVHLLHDYAVEAILRCRRRVGLTLGGEGEPATQWAGISQLVRERLPFEATTSFGPVDLVKVVQVIHPASGEPVPDPTRYPPVPGTFGAPYAIAIEFDAGADEAVLVTNAYFAFNLDPTVLAFAGGKPVPSIAQDRVSAAYACSDCGNMASVHWRLEIATSAFQRIDIVTFDRSQRGTDPGATR